MDMKEFAGKIKEALSDVLGEGYDVEIQEIPKNNGVLLHGIVIRTEEKNISPTIYLKPFWEAYEGGVTLAEVVRKILGIYHNDTPQESVDMSFFRDFKKVKDRICYRLIHAGYNKGLLERIPHVSFMDLAICFYYAYEGNALGSGTILIYNTHMEMWHTTTAELMRLAQGNTPKLFPWECNSMDQVVRELLEIRTPEEARELWGEEEERLFTRDMTMQIVSNRQKIYGAICILYPGVLEELAEKAQANFYILPSSVHEVILLADTMNESPGQLKSMIEDVNRTQVEPEEVLSNSLYYYDRINKRIEIVRT